MKTKSGRLLSSSFVSLCAAALIPVTALAEMPAPPAPGAPPLDNRNSTPADIDKTDADVSDNAERSKEVLDQSKMRKISDQDRKFMEDAAKSDATEIAASRLALANSRSSDIKNFATRMIDDHNKLDQMLKAAAAKQNITVQSAQPDDNVISLLKSLLGDDFDQAYMTHVGIKGHLMAVAAFTDEADRGSNAELKAMAMKALPTIKHHLKMAQDMSSAMSPKAQTPADATKSSY